MACSVKCSVYSWESKDEHACEEPHNSRIAAIRYVLQSASRFTGETIFSLYPSSRKTSFKIVAVCNSHGLRIVIMENFKCITSSTPFRSCYILLIGFLIFNLFAFCLSCVSELFNMVYIYSIILHTRFEILQVSTF